MKMRFSYRVLVWVAALVTAIVMVVTVSVPPVQADEERRSIALSSTSTISLDQAVKMAEQRYKARVVRAEAQHDGGNTIYVLRMLNESGHVWVVRVDASNGAVL